MCQRADQGKPKGDGKSIIQYFTPHGEHDRSLRSLIACELPIRSMCSNCHHLLLRKEFPIRTQGLAGLQSAAGCTLWAGHRPSTVRKKQVLEVLSALTWTLRHTLPCPAHFIVAVSNYIDPPDTVLRTKLLRRYNRLVLACRVHLPQRPPLWVLLPPLAPAYTCLPLHQLNSPLLQSVESPDGRGVTCSPCSSRFHLSRNRKQEESRLFHGPTSPGEWWDPLWGPKSRPGPR